MATGTCAACLLNLKTMLRFCQMGVTGLVSVHPNLKWDREPVSP